MIKLTGRDFVFRNLWKFLEKDQLTTALTELAKIPNTNPYFFHLGKILQSYAYLKKGDYKKSEELAKEAITFFVQYDQKRSLNDLNEDTSGLELNFLESCFAEWILSRSLAGLTLWVESYISANKALQHWETYKIARLPFLKLKENGIHWMNLPTEIKTHIDFLRNLVRAPYTKENWLNMLTPESFVPKNYQSKTNNLKSTKPLVSICIPAYRDAEWLQFTVDAILQRAGYDHFEIVVILQREPENNQDITGRFLENEPYKSNPKIKVVQFDEPLGCERAKDQGVKNSSGELILSFDSHVIPNYNFLQKTVKLFLEYPEVSLLGYGIVDAHENQTIYDYFFDEVPFLMHAIYGTKVIRQNPAMLVPYKPGLYIRHSIMGAAFCMTRSLYNEVGGYILNDRTWGDKAFAISAYLYGYKIFGCPDLLCIHRGHLRSLYHPNTWKENFKITEKGYALEETPLSSLIVGYYYFSEKYFRTYHVPKIKTYCGETFETHWQDFQKIIPSLEERKKKFWKNAVRSVKEYWLEYGDYIWSRLDENEKKHLFPEALP